jgi:Tfp pilus assembly protein PilF
LIGPGLGLLALAVYLITLSAGPYPGPSAALITTHAGLSVFATNANPLWGFIVWLIGLLPVGSLAGRLNVFSALCGAAAVGLLYRIVAEAIYSAIEVNEWNRASAAWAARLGGCGAALFLAFCVPFWIVSNRAHTASLDILLLLVAVYLLFLFWKNDRNVLLFALAFVYGVGMVEFATFIVFAPLFGVTALGLLWSRRKLRAGLLGGIVLCGLAGLSLYLVAAWRFMHTEAFVLREYKSFFLVLWYTWRDQYFLITRSLPSVGWILVVVLTIVPWLTAVWVARRALNEERDWGYYILHFVMAGLTIAVLFNLPIAPWPSLGFYPFLVTPYLLAACSYGYLAAYWCLAPATWWRDSLDPRKPRFVQVSSVTLAALALLLVLVAPFLNGRQASGRPARSINALVNAVIDSLDGRRWLVTDGVIDDNLRVAAAEQRVPVKLVNFQMGQNPVYMKHVASFFPDVRLQSLAQVGALPFLQEWIGTEPEIARKLALLTLPDLWVAGRMTAVPDRTLFVGTTDPKTVDADALFRRQREVWGGVVPLLKQSVSNEDNLAAISRYYLRHLGLVANNLGVLMQDLGRDDLAFACYREARAMEPENISALLNLYVMVQRGYSTPEADSVRRSFTEFAAGLKKKRRIWSLSREHGYVRMPEAFADLGWNWALSGNPGLAVAGFRKAVELAPALTAPKQALAAFYFAQERNEESEALYRELLEKDEKNAAALIGLARLAARGGDLPEAARRLERAEKAAVSKPRMALEWAALYALAGELNRARIVLDELVSVQPDLPRAWALLAGILLQQKDQERLNECVKKMRGMAGRDFAVAWTLAQIALAEGNLSDGRQYLEQAASLRPNSPETIEGLLRLDVQEGNQTLAEEHVRRLIYFAPDNAYGNHILGILQLRRKEYALAENSLRRSARAERTADSLNDLAWVLCERESYDEAEKLVRESLAMVPNPAAWDTLGVILMRTGRLDEAGEALSRAMAIAPDDLEFHVHMLDLQFRKGNTGEARAILNALQGRESELSPEASETLQDVRRRLRG